MHVTLASLAIIRVFHHVPGPPEKSPFELVFENAIARGRARFFCLQNTTLNSTFNLHSPEDIAFGSVDIVLTVIHQWVEHNVVSVVYGALPLTFWLAVKHFEHLLSNNCKSAENGEIGRILVKYKELKFLTRSINAIWSTLVFCVVIEMCLTIIWLHQHVSSGNIIRFFHFAIRFVFQVIVVVLIAEGSKIVCKNKSSYFIIFLILDVTL